MHSLALAVMNRCCGDPFGPECIECGRVVCMDCDDATDAYDRDGAPHKCHRRCAGKAQDWLDTQITTDNDDDDDRPDTQSGESGAAS